MITMLSGTLAAAIQPAVPTTRLISVARFLFPSSPIIRPFSSMTAPVVHKVAQAGFGTGTNELYDKARPSYHPSTLKYIRDAVKGSPPLNVVEIGSGTGIFTRALLAHPSWASDVRALRAVEPSAGMRDVFANTVKDERASVAEGTFSQTGVEDNWADLVVIAQAFHWCPDYDAASAEFARILKPKGIVVFIWNLEDRDAAAWVAQIRDLIEPHEQGTPQFRLNLWRATFSAPSYVAAFDAPVEYTVVHALPGTEQLAAERSASKSYIATLPAGEKARVVEGVREIVRRGDGMRWMDREKGVFEYPYKTLVVVARKK